MRVKSAEFVISNTTYKKCPPENHPEYAFIGRSNVGKSSLINMLTNRKSLAKISTKPGKTQLINHFLINENWFLVDLPGYGWAKVSKSAQAKWGPMIQDYILKRDNLCCLFILIDSRHEPQKIDMEFIFWAGQKGIPLGLIFTKCDKLSKGKTAGNLMTLKKELAKSWEELPLIIESSSVSGTGKEEILNFIDSVNKRFNKSGK